MWYINQHTHDIGGIITHFSPKSPQSHCRQVRSGDVQLQGAVYDLNTGRVEWLGPVLSGVALSICNLLGLIDLFI